MHRKRNHWHHDSGCEANGPLPAVTHPELNREQTCTPPIDGGDYLERELQAKRRAFEGGNLGALYDALGLCDRFRASLPSWLVQQLLRQSKSVLTGSTAKGRGRHSKWITRYRADMVDYWRAAEVAYVRDINVPWKHAYAAAAAILEGTPATGSEDAIEKSYKRYKKRSQTQPYRYHILRDVRFRDRPQKPRPHVWNYIQSLIEDKK